MSYKDLSGLLPDVVPLHSISENGWNLEDDNPVFYVYFGLFSFNI